MGIVFGRTGTKGPEYTVLFKASGYELRNYPGYLTAEVIMNDSNGNNGFGILAKYIGVFGNPENIASQTMDMTHPVIVDSAADKQGQVMAMTHPVIMDSSSVNTGQKISMTSPVVSHKNVMKFVLPSQFRKVSQAPVPTDKRVVIKETPGHCVAVLGFSGYYTPDKGIEQFKNLVKLLKKDNFLASKTTSNSANTSSNPNLSNELNDDDYNLDWQVAQYHPPFTLPFCRLNEIWIKLNPKTSPGLQKIIKDTPHANILASSVIDCSNDDANDINDKSIKKSSVDAGEINVSDLK